MKKILAVLLALIVILMFGACSKNKTEDNTTNSTDAVETNDTEEAADNDNEELIVNTSTSGEIKDGACKIDGSEIVIDGKTFEWPVKVSDFIDNGFNLPENVTFNNIKPKTRTVVGNCELSNAAGQSFEVSCVLNTSDSESKLEDCTVLSIKVKDSNTDVIFPGGLTMKSTAGDVLSVYENTSHPDIEVSIHEEDIFCNNKTTGIMCRYVFNTDGSMYEMDFDINYNNVI